MPNYSLVWPSLGKFVPLPTVRPKIELICQVLLYVARYANIAQKPLKMALGLNMIHKDQLWSFMATFAPKLPVLSKFGEMQQIWTWVTHFDEDCQTCPNISNSGIFLPAMLTYGALWIETSNLANSITVSAVLRTSVTVCYIWRFGALWDKIGGIWPEDATNGPICLIKA
jgi:hypothetical protein